MARYEVRVSGRLSERARGALCSLEVQAAASGCVAGELDASDERGVFGVRCVEPGETV